MNYIIPLGIWVLAAIFGCCSLGMLKVAWQAHIHGPFEFLEVVCMVLFAVLIALFSCALTITAYKHWP